MSVLGNGQSRSSGERRISTTRPRPIRPLFLLMLTRAMPAEEKRWPIFLEMLPLSAATYSDRALGAYPCTWSGNVGHDGNGAKTGSRRSPTWASTQRRLQTFTFGRISG